MSAVPRRPGRPRDERREVAILEAAADLLAEEGFDRLSIEAVASRAGASRATIYRRWSSKSELVVAALHARVEQSVPVPDTGTLRGDLAALLAWYSTRADRKTDQLAGLVHAMRRDDGLRARALGDLVDLSDTSVTGPLLDRARGRGELRQDTDATTLTEALTAHIYLRALVEGRPMDEEWIQRIVDTVLLPMLHVDH